MLGSAGTVTQLLVRWSQGSEEARDHLLPLVYRELRRQARNYFRRERREHTLQATALVHEAYLRLVDQSQVQWRDRAHFFAVAASLMRRILIEHARRRRSAKRGGGERPLTLDESRLALPSPPLDLVALDEALVRLAEISPEQSRLVELRFFAGLSHEEIAATTGVSLSTVERRWRLAKAWLFRELHRSGGPVARRGGRS